MNFGEELLHEILLYVEPFVHASVYKVDDNILVIGSNFIFLVPRFIKIVALYLNFSDHQI